MTIHDSRYIYQFWGPGVFRVFISHSSSQSELAEEIKAGLYSLSIASFVSSSNIGGYEKWQDEIQTALRSTNFVVALVTPEFHNSPWANQEVGFAYAYGIPIIAIMLGVPPKGFIHVHQALDCEGQSVSQIISTIYASLFQSQPLFSVVLDTLINFYSGDPGPEWASQLTLALSRAKYLSFEQEQKLIVTLNAYRHIYHPVAPYLGIADSLKRLTGNRYTLYEPSPGHQQLMVIDENNPQWAWSGWKCVFPGTYLSCCHPNVTTTIYSGQLFPFCNGGSIHHSARWVQLPHS